MTRSEYARVVPYVTKDGSQVRELMHPSVHGNRAQSLAEATVPAGARTLAHRHATTEELYHFTAGDGWLWLDDGWTEVRTGDTVCIPPGAVHCVAAGREPMRILCCCAPAYRHEDTELVEPQPPGPVG